MMTYHCNVVELFNKWSNSIHFFNKVVTKNFNDLGARLLAVLGVEHSCLSFSLEVRIIKRFVSLHAGVAVWVGNVLVVSIGRHDWEAAWRDSMMCCVLKSRDSCLSCKCIWLLKFKIRFKLHLEVKEILFSKRFKGCVVVNGWHVLRY